MQCTHCDNGQMRLVRFENRREIYACKSCGFESLLLDCHFCERRSVRQKPDSENGVAVWACYRCQIDQHKCPSCNFDWVIPASIHDAKATHWECQGCKARWESKEMIK